MGGASLLTDDPSLLTAASSILTVEARHDAYLRTGVKGSPFPTSFDTVLTAAFAYNLAQLFIVSCPQSLPIPLLPKLTLEAPPPTPNLAPVAAGTELTFSYDPSALDGKFDPATQRLYIGLINSVTNVTYTQASTPKAGTAIIPVPEGAAGAAFAVLTTYDGSAALTEDQLSEYGTLAGPAEVILS